MARPRLGESESKRLQMVITEDELEAIDEWQHESRVASRSEAIRRLTFMGLILGRLADKANASRVQLWESYQNGADDLLVGLKEDHPDWKAIATMALDVLGRLAEPQAELSHQINAMAEISVRMREARAANEAIELAQRVETEAREKLKTLAAAYCASEGTDQ